MKYRSFINTTSKTTAVVTLLECNPPSINDVQIAKRMIQYSDTNRFIFIKKSPRLLAETQELYLRCMLPEMASSIFLQEDIQTETQLAQWVAERGYTSSVILKNTPARIAGFSEQIYVEPDIIIDESSIEEFMKSMPNKYLLTEQLYEELKS